MRMTKNFGVLDLQATPLGDIRLQRRKVLQLGGIEIFEVKLGEEYLMSSLFHEAEVAFADLGLSELKTSSWDVIVGGLGLGYTALAALKYKQVKSLIVVEYLEPVISWHKRGLVPLGSMLTTDNRCRFVEGDFFAMSSSLKQGFDPDQAGRRFDAILLDIDHTPSNYLHSRHASFYEPKGLTNLSEHLKPNGVFALWSTDPPDPEFESRLKSVFGNAKSHLVNFNNPLLDKVASNTVYVARKE